MLRRERGREVRGCRSKGEKGVAADGDFSRRRRGIKEEEYWSEGKRGNTDEGGLSKRRRGREDGDVGVKERRMFMMIVADEEVEEEQENFEVKVTSNVYDGGFSRRVGGRRAEGEH